MTALFWIFLGVAGLARKIMRRLPNQASRFLVCTLSLRLSALPPYSCAFCYMRCLRRCMYSPDATIHLEKGLCASPRTSLNAYFPRLHPAALSCAQLLFGFLLVLDPWLVLIVDCIIQNWKGDAFKLFTLYQNAEARGRDMKGDKGYGARVVRDRAALALAYCVQLQPTRHPTTPTL